MNGKVDTLTSGMGSINNNSMLLHGSTGKLPESGSGFNPKNSTDKKKPMNVKTGGADMMRKAAITKLMM